MQKTLVINQKECAGILSVESCMPAMADALKAVSLNQIKMLQRTMIPHESGNMLANMPASLLSKNVTGAKVIIFPGPQAAKDKTNQGIIPLFDTESGALIAIVDAELITVIRTAATSAVATQALANKNAKTVAILGSGKQGRAHARAMIAVRKIEKVYFWDVIEAASISACEELSKQYPAIEFVSCATAQKAVEGADIICTTTTAKAPEPILQGQWVKAGAHINAIGACSANSRELDAKAVEISSVFVDWQEAAGRDAGDLIIPYEKGEIKGQKLTCEIGKVILGQEKGRKTQEEITMFESVGISIEDIAAAFMIYETAKAQGIGTYLEI